MLEKSVVFFGTADSIREGFKNKKIVEYSTKGLTPPAFVEKIFIS